MNKIVDKILAMYDEEIKVLETQMHDARNNKDMSRYAVLSVKWEELYKLFNETLKIINE